MVRFRNFVLAAVATVVLSLGDTANAGVVFDNLSATTQANDPLSGDGPQGASFLTGGASSGLTLSDVKLLISGDNTSKNSFTVSLLNDNGSNSPGSFITTLATISDSDLNSTPTAYDISGLSVALAANTSYWIELSGSTSSVNWSYATTDAGVGVASGYDAYYATGYQTGDLVVTSNTVVIPYGPYQMQVTTVPEPGTFSLALSALGIGVLGMARRRKASSC